MKVTRRNVLMSTLFGAGYVGLRALATGIPAAVLLKGTRAFADGSVSCVDRSKAQYLILQTSGQGDPINANAPGTYGELPIYGDANIAHNQDLSMAATPLMLGSVATKAALPWSTLPQPVLDRMNFWHIMTNTPVHPREPDVMRLLNTTAYNEMLPSILAKQLAPCLGTLQSQPITLGASSPSEGLTFAGQALPIIPPLALKATLTNPAGPLAGLTNLQTLRDQTLSQLDGIYRGSATKAQKSYLDALITSQSQVRGINQDLLAALGMIKDNSVTSQIIAAIVLIQMNVTPVISIHIPFGGDNHNDALLATETLQTASGVASIALLMSKLASNSNAYGPLTDQVSFASLNVFGRTIGPSTFVGGIDGRQHNQNHQVSLTIGKPFKSGIIGGVGLVKPSDPSQDYGALAIDSQSGLGVIGGGDIKPVDTLASFGKTVMAAVGIDATTIDGSVKTGKVVQGALV